MGAFSRSWTVTQRSSVVTLRNERIPHWEGLVTREGESIHYFPIRCVMLVLLSAGIKIPVRHQIPRGATQTHQVSINSPHHSKYTRFYSHRGVAIHRKWQLYHQSLSIPPIFMMKVDSVLLFLSALPCHSRYWTYLLLIASMYTSGTLLENQTRNFTKKLQFGKITDVFEFWHMALLKNQLISGIIN